MTRWARRTSLGVAMACNLACHAPPSPVVSRPCQPPRSTTVVVDPRHDAAPAVRALTRGGELHRRWVAELPRGSHGLTPDGEGGVWLVSGQSSTKTSMLLHYDASGNQEPVSVPGVGQVAPVRASGNDVLALQWGRFGSGLFTVMGLRGGGSVDRTRGFDPSFSIPGIFRSLQIRPLGDRLILFGVDVTAGGEVPALLDIDSDGTVRHQPLPQIQALRGTGLGVTERRRFIQADLQGEHALFAFDPKGRISWHRRIEIVEAFYVEISGDRWGLEGPTLRGDRVQLVGFNQTRIGGILSPRGTYRASLSVAGDLIGFDTVGGSPASGRTANNAQGDVAVVLERDDAREVTVIRETDFIAAPLDAVEGCHDPWTAEVAVDAHQRVFLLLNCMGQAEPDAHVASMRLLLFDGAGATVAADRHETHARRSIGDDDFGTHAFR